MANKKENKKLTLDDLILRKTQGNLDKMQIKMYNSKELGGEIEIRKINLKKYMELLNGANDDDLVESIELMCTLIFECCPLFKENSKELMETYECSVPTDLPLCVLNDNLKEIKEIGAIINSFYGLEELNKEIKNS